MPPLTVPTIQWLGDVDGQLRIIDQTLLPNELKLIELTDEQAVWEAIKSLRVRGAPAIGIAAAYGTVVGLRKLRDRPLAEARNKLQELIEYLAASRPTAVNLFWALERIRQTAAAAKTSSVDELSQVILAEAKAIHEQDRQMCHAIGRHGADLFQQQQHQRLLTHCNAGGLATAEYGTALSVIFTMADRGQQVQVFVDETRPLFQGARLTAWELAQRQIDSTLICDSMAGHVMRLGRVDAVITGADRIAANGDTANKIGTYSLAVLARAHGIPFYIAAPTSTFDLNIESGEEIPIEQREPAEITTIDQRSVAPAGIGVYNPAFDVTPADYIEAIITDRGVIQPVNALQIRRVLGIA